MGHVSDIAWFAVVAIDNFGPMVPTPWPRHAQEVIQHGPRLLSLSEDQIGAVAVLIS